MKSWTICYSIIPRVFLSGHAQNVYGEQKLINLWNGQWFNIKLVVVQQWTHSRWNEWLTDCCLHSRASRWFYPSCFICPCQMKWFYVRDEYRCQYNNYLFLKKIQLLPWRTYKSTGRVVCTSHWVTENSDQVRARKFSFTRLQKNLNDFLPTSGRGHVRPKTFSESNTTTVTYGYLSGSYYLGNK